MKFQLTLTTPWTDSSGKKIMQEEVAICSVVSSGDFVEYSVCEITSVNNQPDYYKPHMGGAIRADLFKDGKIGLKQISFNV